MLEYDVLSLSLEEYSQVTLAQSLLVICSEIRENALIISAKWFEVAARGLSSPAVCVRRPPSMGWRR